MVRTIWLQYKQYTMEVVVVVGGGGGGGGGWWWKTRGILPDDGTLVGKM